ncbi:hypothetical protein BC832DRAFT_565501 [Gaertneriomyces semiglobifer]|nr:hypothetical protein BC832DRAFT_565501 [Gaertneriomyces semiglobifer]
MEDKFGERWRFRFGRAEANRLTGYPSASRLGYCGWFSGVSYSVIVCGSLAPVPRLLSVVLWHQFLGYCRWFSGISSSVIVGDFWSYGYQMAGALGHTDIRWLVFLAIRISDGWCSWPYGFQMAGVLGHTDIRWLVFLAIRIPDGWCSWPHGSPCYWYRF